MSNWMTVSITADITNATGFHFQREFTSFNDVLPIPKPLREIYAGSDSSFVKSNVEKGLKWLIENRPQRTSVLAIARIYRAWQISGYFDCYEWSIDNWGVKRDMDKLKFDEDTNTLFFVVPWCIPIGALEALSDKFPNVAFTGEFAEEQDGWYSGTLDIFAGQCDLSEDEEFSTEAYERCFALNGGEACYEYKNGKYVLIDD